MGISRAIPNTNIGRSNAVETGCIKQGSLPPGEQVLNPQTRDRLLGARVPYNDGLNNVAAAQANLSGNTPLKDADVGRCKMFNSHYIQVFNFGVVRGKYPASERAFFQLDINTGNVPPMTNDADVALWAKRLVEGEAARLLAGGVAMANPDISEVAALRTTLDASLLMQNTLKGLLETRQGELDALNVDVDKLIKRVWDEVEAYYSELEPATKRNFCRLWGIIYVTDGAPATLTGLVKGTDGVGIEGAEIVVVQTGAKAVTNAEGRYVLNTTVVGPVTLEASFPALPSAGTDITIPEHDHGLNMDVADIVLG